MAKKRNEELKELAREKAETAVSWKLKDEDKRFLRSMNVRPD